MSPTAGRAPAGYTMSQQLADPFSVANPPAIAPDTGPDADVIPLNRKADSFHDIGYNTPPPPSTVPYGWRMVRHPRGWLLTHCDAEWPVIERIVRERRGGMTYGAIAQRLAEEGVPAPSGGRSSRRWITERVRTLVHHYAPTVAQMPSTPGVGPAAPVPDSEQLDREYDELQRRGRELGLLDEDDE